MERQEAVKAYAAWLCVCFFWGTTYLAIRIGVQNLPPALFAGIRWLIAGSLLLLILRIRGIPFPGREEYKTLAVVGILLLVVANGCVVWAEQWVPSGITALIVATLPFWMAGFEALLPGGTPLNIRKIMGIIIGFSGLILLFYPDLRASFEKTYLWGVLVLCIAPFSWAIGSLYSKYKPVKSHPLVAAAWQMVIAGVVLTIIGILAKEVPQFHFSNAGFGAMAYLVIFGSIVGYGSYIYSLSKLPATKVSLFAYVNPVIAVFLGWLILSERLDGYVFAATILILSGVLLVKTSKS